MVTERRAQKAASQAVAGVLKLFARTARARQIYADNNAVIARMRKELVSAFDDLMRTVPDVSLKVRSDSFLFEEQPVLEESNPDESIPFAFYRDGIRRLDFSRGLRDREIDVLVAATAQGFSFSGLGDDIVAYLWRHDLEHVRYVVVDTSIIDATQASPGSPVELGPVSDVDAQIDGLLRSIYGDSSEDVGPRTVHVDATDLPAKQIAERLDTVDEMAPGFHPPRGFLHAPGYLDDLTTEISAFTDRDITLRAMYCGFWALSEQNLGGASSESICEAMLRAYDAALVEEDLVVATYVVRAMQRVAESGSGRAREWLDRAIDDARLRQVTTIMSRSSESEASQNGFAFLRSCGKRALDSLLSQIPGIAEPHLRRSYADLVLELGGGHDIDRIQTLVTNEQAFVAQEGIYLLGKIGNDAAIRLLEHCSDHPHPAVRLAFVEHLHRLPEDRRYATAVRLLDDRDDRIKIAAAKALATSTHQDAGLVMKELIRKPEFAGAPYEVQAAFLETFARLSQVWSLRFLTKFVKKGISLLAKHDTEELAVAAIRALASVPTQRTIDCLEEAAKSRKKRPRDAAREVLEQLKGAKA